MPSKKSEMTKGQKREREKHNKSVKGKEMGKQKKNALDQKFQKNIDIKPKTQAQSEYLMNIESKDLIISEGPAGTGKSFIALAFAAKQLVEGEKEKIIITRPLVESGKEVGALPGELAEKLDPFFQPPKDILNELLGESYVDYLIKTESIVLQPLEFLRGSTFKRALIVLDEAQNTTKEQMKLFLSRIGGGSKIIVNGDTSQSDLDNKEIDGLTSAREKLWNLEEVGLIDFDEEDIVRSKLAKKIIQAYR